MSRQPPDVDQSKSKTDTSFKVYINEGEMYQIQEWVLKHKNIGTGGDLFGLWLDDHTAVVQFVLGPGKKCRRTTTSFFQDVQYLQEAGSYLTDKHGLCNIGQWHSHHRIRLSKPSHGDENTVWENMPVLGLNKYIVFIANITNQVTVNCFLFHYQSRERSVTQGQFKYLRRNSPLRLNTMVLQNTFDGTESFNNPAMYEREMKFLRKIDTEDNDWNKNIRIYTGNKEQFNDNISVQHAQHNMNSSRNKYAEDNNVISNRENVEDFTKNQDKYEVNTQHDQPKNFSHELISDQTRELQKHKTESSQGTQAEKAISYRNQGTQTVQTARETRDYIPQQNNYFLEKKTDSCTPKSSDVTDMLSAEKADTRNGQTMTRKLPHIADNKLVQSRETAPSTGERSPQNPNYKVTSWNVYEQNPKEKTANQKPKPSQGHMLQAESVTPSQFHDTGNVPTETQQSSNTAFLANKDHPSRQTRYSKRKTENCTPRSHVSKAYEIEQVKKVVTVRVQPIRDRQAVSQQPPHKARHDDPSRRQAAHLTIDRSSPNNNTYKRRQKEGTAKTNDQVPKNKGHSTNLQTHQQQYEHQRTRTTDYGHKNTKSSSRISDMSINQPSQKRRSRQYDNVKDNHEKLQHYQSPYPESKIPLSENQSTLGERPNAPTGMIRTKESLHKEAQNEKTHDKTDGNNMPVGRVDPNNTSNERGQHSHVNNESSMLKPVSRRHTQTKTVVTYQDHESRKENGNQPGEKRRSGRYDNVIGESSRYERGPNLQSENKLSQSREQATLNERPNTTSGTAQAEERRHTKVQNKKRDTTKKNCQIC